jgi:hypothetical protein
MAACQRAFARVCTNTLNRFVVVLMCEQAMEEEMEHRCFVCGLERCVRA